MSSALHRVTRGSIDPPGPGTFNAETALFVADARTCRAVRTRDGRSRPGTRDWSSCRSKRSRPRRPNRCRMRERASVAVRLRLADLEAGGRGGRDAARHRARLASLLQHGTAALARLAGTAGPDDGDRARRHLPRASPSACPTKRTRRPHLPHVLPGGRISKAIWNRALGERRHIERAASRALAFWAAPTARSFPFRKLLAGRNGEAHRPGVRPSRVERRLSLQHRRQA